jgi:hypothetical protein
METHLVLVGVHVLFSVAVCIAYIAFEESL